MGYRTSTIESNTPYPTRGLYGRARITHINRDKSDQVWVEKVKNVDSQKKSDLDEKKSRCYFEVEVGLKKEADENVCRAFSIEHQNIEHYFPKYTKFVKETSSRKYFSFVVEVKDSKNIKNEKVQVNYNIHPKLRKKKQLLKEIRGDYKYICTLNIESQAVTPPCITVQPPLKITVNLGFLEGKFNDKKHSFNSLKGAENFISKWLSNESEKIQEISNELSRSK